MLFPLVTTAYEYAYEARRMDLSLVSAVFFSFVTISR